MNDERKWLEGLLKHVDQPDEIDLEYDKIKKGLKMGSFFAALSMIFFTTFSSDYLLFSLGGFIVGLICGTFIWVRSIHVNIQKTRPYLNKETIESRLAELNNSQ